MRDELDNSNLNNNSSLVREIISWSLAILIALMFALIFRGYVLDQRLVDGDSMNNTLHTGEKVLVYKLGYLFSHPKKNDIIILRIDEGEASKIPFSDKLPFLKKIMPHKQDTYYIKRVIGVPGDNLDIKDGKVWINDKMLTETYANGETYPNGDITFPIEVPEGKLFVMGDNRENSRDSRIIGLVENKRVEGRAFFRVWPIDSIGTIN